jgi:hypothetical protein
MAAAAAGAAEVVARAGTARRRHLLAGGAVLAAALLAGCDGSSDKAYAIGPTTACLRDHGQPPMAPPNDSHTIRLEWAYLRFHPSIDEAKAFDVSQLNTAFGGYQYHRKRYGNVSLIWATGGRRNLAGPGKDEVKTVERCLKA